MAMRLLLDTNILLMSAFGVLPVKARRMIEDNANTLCFSSISMWEIVIKNAAGRRDFQVDANVMYHSLLAHGYEEIKVDSRHALRVALLPVFHHDPFDRMILAQAAVEGITLLTSDAMVAKYPGNIVHTPKVAHR